MTKSVAGERVVELIMGRAAWGIEERAKCRAKLCQVHGCLGFSTKSPRGAERYRYAVARLMPNALASS